MKTNRIIAAMLCVLLVLTVACQLYVLRGVRNAQRSLLWAYNTMSSDIAHLKGTIRDGYSSFAYITSPEHGPMFERIANHLFDISSEELAHRYGFDILTAHACLLAFDDLLNVDRHELGMARFEALGSVAGPFLLDAFRDNKTQGEMRPSFLARALSNCLTPEIEAALVSIAKDEMHQQYVRSHAVRTLRAAKTDYAHEYIKSEFLRHMQMDASRRWSPLYRSLIYSAGAVNDIDVVQGLLNIIDEQRVGRTLDYILNAVIALSDIGDASAAPVLISLAEDKCWLGLLPHICLGLARMNHPEADSMTQAALEQHAWPAWHAEILKQAANEVQKRKQSQPSP